MVKKEFMTGIYKITSPSGRIYIGQSWNITRRKKSYSLYKCERQKILFNSLCKYGFDAHSFELVHLLPSDVSQETLNQYETIYIKLYKDCGVLMLNATNGGAGSKGYKHNILSREKMSVSAKKRGVSPERLKKMHEANTGRKLSNSVKEAIRKKLIGVKHTPERIANFKKSFAGKWKSNSGSFKVGNGAKLNNTQVSEIRLKYKPRVYSFRKLAKEYNVDNKSIRGIVSNKTKCYL
jgi:group I intron endonuclease